MQKKLCDLIKKIAKRIGITVDSLKKHLLLFAIIISTAILIVSIIIFICSRSALWLWEDWNIIKMFKPENWIGWWISAVSISVSSFLSYSIFKYNKTQKEIEEKKQVAKKEQEKKAALIAWATYLQVKSLKVVPLHIVDLKSQEIFSKLKLESTKKKVLQVTLISNTIMPVGYAFDVEKVKILAIKKLFDTDNAEEYEHAFDKACSFSQLNESFEEINLIYETFVLGNKTILNLFFVYEFNDECLTQIEYYNMFHRHITDVKWEITGSIYDLNNENIKSNLCMILDSEVKINQKGKKLKVIKVNYKLINVN